MSDTLAEHLAQRNAEHETEYHLMLTEADVVDLAAGCVNASVRATARAVIDWALDDERKAAANVAQETHKRRKAAARKSELVAEGSPSSR